METARHDCRDDGICDPLASGRVEQGHDEVMSVAITRCIAVQVAASVLRGMIKGGSDQLASEA